MKTTLEIIRDCAHRGGYESLRDQLDLAIASQKPELEKQEEEDGSRLSRVEVINHTRGGSGREYIVIQEGIDIMLDYQDQGRTLKIFIMDKNY